MPIDIQNQGFRKNIIDEILNNENRERKEDSKIRFEVYKDRQERFLRELLAKEFGKEALDQLRIISSINIQKRIVNEQASIYKNDPERTFMTDGVEPTEAETKQIENLYKFSKANLRLKRSNRAFKLHNQCALQVWPHNGIIDIRILRPHQYDVIPSSESPEMPQVYILNVMDDTQLPLHPDQDNTNQKIGDRDDAEKRARMRFVWWSAELNFMTDGNGKLLSFDVDTDGNAVPVMRPNPLGVLPFIDIHDEKDFEFWVRKGSAATGFGLTLSTILTDISSINKMQGWGQCVITGENIPENLRVGYDRIIRLITEPGGTAPTFEFVSADVDLNAALSMVDMLVNLFLSAEGLDPKIISGKGEASNFSSALERFLAEISKFSATKDDFDLFETVETKLFKFFIAWSNILQNTDALIPDLQGGQIDPRMEVNVEFAEPDMLDTDADKLKNADTRMKMKMLSRVEAIAEDRDITEDEALEVIKKIDEQNAATMKNVLNALGGENGQVGRNQESNLPGKPGEDVRQNVPGQRGTEAENRDGDNSQNTEQNPART